MTDLGYDHDIELVRSVLERLEQEDAGSSGETLEADRIVVADVGDALFALADLARRLGVDPESALRARALRAECRDTGCRTEPDPIVGG